MEMVELMFVSIIKLFDMLREDHLVISHWDLNICHYVCDPFTLSNGLSHVGLIVEFSAQIT